MQQPIVLYSVETNSKHMLYYSTSLQFVHKLAVERQFMCSEKSNFEIF